MAEMPALIQSQTMTLKVMKWWQCVMPYHRGRKGPTKIRQWLSLLQEPCRVSSQRKTKPLLMTLHLLSRHDKIIIHMLGFFLLTCIMVCSNPQQSIRNQLSFIWSSYAPKISILLQYQKLPNAIAACDMILKEHLYHICVQTLISPGKSHKLCSCLLTSCVRTVNKQLPLARVILWRHRSYIFCQL